MGEIRETLIGIFRVFCCISRLSFYLAEFTGMSVSKGNLELKHRAQILGREPLGPSVVKRKRAIHRFFVIFAAQAHHRSVKPRRNDFDSGLRRLSLRVPGRRLFNCNPPDF